MPCPAKCGELVAVRTRRIGEEAGASPWAFGFRRLVGECREKREIYVHAHRRQVFSDGLCCSPDKERLGPAGRRENRRAHGTSRALFTFCSEWMMPSTS